MKLATKTQMPLPQAIRELLPQNLLFQEFGVHTLLICEMSLQEIIYIVLVHYDELEISFAGNLFFSNLLL